MSRYNRPTYTHLGPGAWTPAVKALIITTAAVFAVQILDQISGAGFVTRTFGLVPALVTRSLHVWQLVTYIFLHSMGVFHILFNMLALWMFGTQLEEYWGTREFTKFFFICGIGAGLTTVLLTPGSLIPTIGASGAVYGILLAYGVLFPNRIIYFFIFPIPAKWFVIMLGGIAFVSSITATGGGIAHVAHLGGMLVGFLYMKGGHVFSDVRVRYDRWRRNRLRRKFEVYYNERHRDDDEKTRRWRN